MDGWAIAPRNGAARAQVGLEHVGRKSDGRNEAARGGRRHTKRRRPHFFPPLDVGDRIAAIEYVENNFGHSWKSLLDAAQKLAALSLDANRAFEAMVWLKKLASFIESDPPPRRRKNATEPSLKLPGLERSIATALSEANRIQLGVSQAVKSSSASTQRLQEILEEVSPKFRELVLDPRIMVGVAVLALVQRDDVKLTKADTYKLLSNVAQAAGVEEFPDDLSRWKSRVESINDVLRVVRLRLEPEAHYAVDAETFKKEFLAR